MDLTWIDNIENINWKELSNLYKIAPLGNKSPDNLKMVFTASLYVFFVYKDDELIGVGRALADGVDCSYLCDVAVYPDYQGEGIGKKIIQKLVNASKGHQKIILYAVPGKETFYEKVGFSKMKTAMAIFKNQIQAGEWGLIDVNANV